MALQDGFANFEGASTAEEAGRIPAWRNRPEAYVPTLFANFRDAVNLRQLLECGSLLPLLETDSTGFCDFSIVDPMPNSGTPWPHAPSHELSEGGTYFVTAGAYLKAHYFRGADRLGVLHRGLLTVARDYGWLFEAWAVFSNHYHFVAHSPPDVPDAPSLPEMLSTLHVKTAKWVNKLDHRPGRRVWFNFRETRLTVPEILSGTVKLRSSKCRETRAGKPVANQYPWCSARWFESKSSAAMAKSIYRFKTDRLQMLDDFEPAPALNGRG